MFQLLKLPPRKFEPWFVLRSFFFLKLLFISVNLTYGLSWNIVTMSGLVLDMLSQRNGYVRPLVQHLLPHRHNIASLSPSMGIILVDVHLNRLNWFCFPLLVRGPLFILIDYMIFMSPFPDVMSMSTVPSITQLNSGILCLQNTFLWPMI